MREIKCVHCSKKKTAKDHIFIGDAIKAGFEVVYDISNGLTMMYLCKDCSDKIRHNVQIIEEILDKPIGDVNLMNLSNRRE